MISLLYSIFVLRSKGPRIYSNSLQSLHACFCRFSILSFKKPRLSQNQCNDVGGRWSWTCGCNASVFVWAASWKHCLNGSSHKTTCWATLMICAIRRRYRIHIDIFCVFYFGGVLHESRYKRDVWMSMTMAQLCLPERCFLSVGSLVTYINHTSLKDLCVHSGRVPYAKEGMYIHMVSIVLTYLRSRW